MQQLKLFVSQLIDISDQEFNQFMVSSQTTRFKRLDILSKRGKVPQDIYFINKGIIRVLVDDPHGTEHTIYFAMENQFIADYSSFILKQPSLYTLQALEDTEVIVMPRTSIDWGYKNLKEGEKLGRLIAEYYFIYQDQRIKNQYALSPKERYDSITEVFPNIHNRAPQHMIASYLGITSVHLSRLKKTTRGKT